MGATESKVDPEATAEMEEANKAKAKKEEVKQYNESDIELPHEGAFAYIGVRNRFYEKLEKQRAAAAAAEKSTTKEAKTKIVTEKELAAAIEKAKAVAILSPTPSSHPSEDLRENKKKVMNILNKCESIGLEPYSSETPEINHAINKVILWMLRCSGDIEGSSMDGQYWKMAGVNLQWGGRAKSYLQSGSGSTTNVATNRSFSVGEDDDWSDDKIMVEEEDEDSKDEKRQRPSAEGAEHDDGRKTSSSRRGRINPVNGEDGQIRLPEEEPAVVEDSVHKVTSIEEAGGSHLSNSAYPNGDGHNHRQSLLVAGEICRPSGPAGDGPLVVEDNNNNGNGNFNNEESHELKLENAAVRNCMSPSSFDSCQLRLYKTLVTTLTEAWIRKPGTRLQDNTFIPLFDHDKQEEVYDEKKISGVCRVCEKRLKDLDAVIDHFTVDERHTQQMNELDNFPNVEAVEITNFNASRIPFKKGSVSVYFRENKIEEINPFPPSLPSFFYDGSEC